MIHLENSALETLYLSFLQNLEEIGAIIQHKNICYSNGFSAYVRVEGFYQDFRLSDHSTGVRRSTHTFNVCVDNFEKIIEMVCQHTKPELFEEIEYLKDYSICSLEPGHHLLNNSDYKIVKCFFTKKGKLMYNVSRPNYATKLIRKNG